MSPTQPDAPMVKRPAPHVLRRMVIGYLMACLAAAILHPVLLLMHDIIALGFKPAFGAVVFGDLVAIVIFGFLFIALCAAPFATALVVVAQVLNRETQTFMAVGGAIIGPIVGMIAALMAGSGVVLGSLVLYALLGATGGAVYWNWVIRRPVAR